MPRMIRGVAALLLFAATVGFSQLPARAADRCAARGGGPQPSDFVLPPVSSPFIFRVPDGAVYPVAGSDGRIHLAYLAQVTNTTEAPGKDFRAVPVDPLANFQPTGRNFVKDVDGRVITNLIQPFSRTPQEAEDPPVVPPPGTIYTDKLLPGGSGLVYFDVTYANAEAVPTLISHRLFVDLNERGVTKHSAFTTPVPVSCQKPVVLSPPLRGPGWFDANGCCAVINGHRSAALHLDGELRPAQQFAIDWLQIGADHRCCTGDPRRLQSWIGYGAPIFAAASGTVFSVLRNQPDQKPVGTVRNISLVTLTGNSIVEDIGRGRFILYAHMQPGSIPALLRPGTHIEVGQQIGRVGNSGNSGAPHLHIHVMDSPSALVSSGRPFVFNRMQVQGHVVGPEGPAVDELIAGKPLPITTRGSGTQFRTMPLSSTVFAF